jgi:amino acid transporter
VIALLIIAFILIINTAILGSARTLYQASADGYTIGGLTKLSKRRVPTRAMGFDVAVNLLLMMLGTPIAILAASTVGYMITNILDLIAGWMLDKDTRHMQVPFRAPRAILRLAPALAGFNFVLLFAGGPSWGWDSVAIGWGIVLLSIPLYLYRQWSDERRAPPDTRPAARAAVQA